MSEKHDQEKARWDLLPFKAVERVVDVLTYGAKKYAPDGWRNVPDARRRYYAAALRHLTAWWDGSPTDPEGGLPHLAHAACCILFLLEADPEPEGILNVQGVRQTISKFRVDSAPMSIRQEGPVNFEADPEPEPFWVVVRLPIGATSTLYWNAGQRYWVYELKHATPYHDKLLT